MIGRPTTFQQPNYVNVLFASSDRSVIGESLKRKDDFNKQPIDGRAKCDRTVSRELVKPKINKASACMKLDLDKYLRSDDDCHERKLSAKTSGTKKKCKSLNSKQETKTLATEKHFKSKSVEDALQVIENRKKSIRAKLVMKKENLLTQEEEQDIHTRADLYAITTVPDLNYCISVEKDTVRQAPGWCSNYHNETVSPPRKKRRRNYGNTNCYVTHHNDDDIFDNTKMLSIGTRLVKPPTKLVELVAQAISHSPDGLLQVQQIYTFLQNKYPFFRYMDRVAINSWRSSVRHALYQKWFRKIRFDLSFISSKGCYWAINNKNNPKEWSLPSNRCLSSVERCICAGSIEVTTEIPELQVFNLLQEVAAIANCLMSSDKENEDTLDTDQVDVSSSEENSDQILNAADWNCEEMFLSSTESGHGTMSPDVSPPFHQFSDKKKVKREKSVDEDLLSTPIKYDSNRNNATAFNSPKSNHGQQPSRSIGRSEISPLIHWIPDWEEYGSYIISPQNVGMQRYVLGLPNPVKSEINRTESDNESSICSNVKTELGLTENEENSPIKFCSDTSDCESSDFEMIAEFSRSNTGSPDLLLGSL